MSPIFTFIVIVLGLLAIANIIVGVANDAINFMNAAWGSRVARYRTILIVASVGILIGTLTSNGMMEVARSGVFYPENFTFSEVMMLFLGMMLGNVILFNIFNTLGFPLPRPYQWYSVSWAQLSPWQDIKPTYLPKLAFKTFHDTSTQEKRWLSYRESSPLSS